MLLKEFNYHFSNMNLEEFKNYFKEDWSDTNVFRKNNIILIKLDHIYWYDVDKKEWSDDSYKELEENETELTFCQSRKYVFRGTYIGNLLNSYFVGKLKAKDFALLFPEYNFFLEQAIKLNLPFVIQAFRQDHSYIKNLKTTSLVKAMEMSPSQMNALQTKSVLTSSPFLYYQERLGRLVPSFKGIQDELFEGLLDIAFNDKVSNFDLDYYCQNIIGKKGISLKNKIEKIKGYIENNFHEYRLNRDILRGTGLLDTHKYPEFPKAEDLTTLIPQIQAEAISAQDAVKNLEYNEQYQSVYQKLVPFEFEDENYRIIVPKKVEELDFEGLALHHCVGTYKGVIAEGVEVVLFLRKKDEPDKPYYTIDIDTEGYIRQIHCKYNGNLQDDPDCDQLVNFLDKWADAKSGMVNKKSIQLVYGAVCHL